MTKQITTAAISAALIVVFAFTGQTAPRLTIMESSFDFGYIPQQSKVAHTFWLFSTGDDDLEILNVVPGCGCTKAPLEKSRLRPGDSTRLVIIFDTQRFRGRTTKRPKIVTNEGPPDKHLSVFSNVIPTTDSTAPIRIEPYGAVFDLEKVRQITPLEITNVSNQPVTLEMISYDTEFLAVDLPKTVAPGATASGTVTIRDDVMDMSFAKSFTIDVYSAGDQNERPVRFSVPITISREPGELKAVFAPPPGSRDAKEVEK